MDEQWIKTFRSEIGDFRETINAFQRGELDKKAYKGTSGGMGTYAQRDQTEHMLRLRLPGGRLTVERLKFLADTVERYDIQKMKLTTCETVQLHNLSSDQVPVIMEAAIDSGIFSRGGGGDNPRNVMCSPLSGVQEGEAFDVMPWAEAATEYLLSICRDIHMPRKLKIAFCNGVDDCVHTAFRDMGFLAQPDGTFALRIAGGLGNNHRMGVLVDEAVAPREILYYIKAMIDTFCAHGNYQNRAKARTRYMQETLGPDGLKAAYLAHVTAAKAAGGLEITRLESPADLDKGNGEAISNPRATPQKQAGLYAVEYHPIGGILPLEKPAALYELLRDMPGAECRVAPNETIYIINLSAEEARKVLAATEDSAKTVFEHSVACIGATICQQGVRDSQSLLQAAVAAVQEAGLPDGALPRICISGCPSSCAAHQAGAIGFQGCVKPVDGKPQPAFKMFLGGNDALGAARFGEPAATVLERNIPTLLVELGHAASALGWEQWSAGHGDELNAIIAKYA